MKLKLALSLVLLSACSHEGGLSSLIPDRSPDYRSSRIGNALEVPPNLVAVGGDGALPVPDFAQTESYNSIQAKRNPHGFIEVLPDLYRTAVQNNRITVQSDASLVWAIVKKYWTHNGIVLATEEPNTGLMITAWLTDKNKLPSSGIGGWLNGLLDFGGSDKKDLYRLQFNRVGGNTEITVIHRHAEEEMVGKAHKDEIPDYVWKESNRGKDILEQEMARRIALFISQDLKRQDQTKSSVSKRSETPSASVNKNQAKSASDDFDYYIPKP